MQPDSKGGWMAASGSLISIVSGLTIHEWGVIIGILIGLAGLGGQQYWAWRAHKLREAEARKRGVKL